MHAQRIIEATGERESEFFGRMSQYLAHKADESADKNQDEQAHAYREAAAYLNHAAMQLMLVSR